MSILAYFCFFLLFWIDVYKKHHSLQKGGPLRNDLPIGVVSLGSSSMVVLVLFWALLKDWKPESEQSDQPNALIQARDLDLKTYTMPFKDFTRPSLSSPVE